MLKLYFDDGHDTGIYSWGTLYELGVNYEKNWAEYLKKLEQHHLNRGEGRVVGKDGKVTIKLAKISGNDEEDMQIPDSVTKCRDFTGVDAQAG